MVKLLRVRWLTVLMGIGSLIGSAVSADKSRLAPSNEFLHCQTSLKRFCRHLEECSKTRNEVYYENLYNQTQNLLNSFENLPTNSAADLNRCENYLRVIQDIVGQHSLSSDLGPMPTDSTSYNGKLTMPALEARRRPLSKHVHVKYVCEDQAMRKRKDNKENDVEDERTEELNDFSLISRSNPHTSRIRREPKELE